MADDLLPTVGPGSFAIEEKPLPKVYGGVEFMPTGKKALPPVDVRPGASASDIAKSVAAQGTLGVTADVPGMFGGLANIYDLAREKALYVPLKAAEFTGLMPEGKTAEKFMSGLREVERQPITPPAKDDMLTRTARALEGTAPAYQEGKASQIFGLPVPTPSGMEELETKAIPGLGYRGESPEAVKYGKMSRSATSLAAGPGGVPSIVGRGVAGGLGSYLGQGIGESFEKTQPESAYKEYAEPIATALTTAGALALGKPAAGFFRSGARAEELMSDALSNDIDKGLFDVRGYNRAVESGVEASIADFAAPKSQVRKLLETQIPSATGEASEAASEYSRSLLQGDRTTQSVRNAQDLMEFINQGRPISTVGDITDAAKNAGMAIRDKVYNLARISPLAGAIDFRSLGTYKTAEGRTVPLAQNPNIMGSIEAVTKNAERYDPSYGVIPPKPITLANGAPATSPGNIAFWDMVKRDLDQKIENLYARGNDRDANIAAGMKAAREELVDRLDKIVPGYEIARHKAAETFGAQDAAAAGMNFYGKMKEFDHHDAVKAFQNMPQDQRDLFTHGWLASMRNEIAEKGNLGSVASKFLKPEGQFAQNAKLILGNNYDQFAGEIISENARATAKALAEGKPGAGLLQGIGVSGSLGAASGALLTGIIDYLTSSQFISPKLAGVAAVTGTAGAIGSLARKKYATDVANKIVPLLLSENPRDTARVAEMVQRTPGLADALSKLNTAYQTVSQPKIPLIEQRRPQVQTAPAEPEQQESPATSLPRFSMPSAQARGGVARATGGRIMTADRMISMAKRAKKEIESQTKALLDEPDEHIVKALKVANEHI